MLRFEKCEALLIASIYEFKIVKGVVSWFIDFFFSLEWCKVFGSFAGVYFFMISQIISSSMETVMMAKNADENNSKLPSSSNVLMCRQWWKVCWIYGDQEKYYRYLYGSRKKSSNSENINGGTLKLPKMSTAATHATTAVVTLQQQNLIFQNTSE